MRKVNINQYMQRKVEADQKKSHFTEPGESEMSRCVGKKLSFNFKKELKIIALNCC